MAMGGGFADATEATPAETGTASREEEEPVLGQMGDYKLIEELSHGGMGTVYRAVHVRLGREVALKVLPKGRNTDHRAVARFEREMAAVGKLDHPHIVRATDAGEVDGVQYLAMELIDGFDLTELVDYLGPLGAANSCEIIRQAALGLQCAYEQGLVHRDIKPSNVMVTGAGIAKILDLGLARFHIDKQSNVELTTAGQPMGTADYMAPEQVADTHSVDIRADIYSLGCTFYKILAGQPPFGGVQYSSSFDKMMAHRKEMPPSIQEFRPDLPKKVVAVLEQMLAKDPNERFQKPSDLAETLYPLCAGANLPAMIESAWKAAETAPVPQSTATATPDVEEEPTTSPQKRAKRRVQTAGSSTHSKSRSQYSNFYVMPPPPKPQWGLWLAIGILSSLLVGILGAYTTTWWLNRDQPTGLSLPPTSVQGWEVPLDRPAVTIPAAESLAGQSGKPPRARGALGEETLVPEPAQIDGLTSWTLETVGHRTPILCAAVAPNGDTLATGSGEGAIRIWDLGNGSLKSILIYPGRDGAVRALDWAPAGNYLAAAYEAGTLMIWNVKSGTVLPDDFSTRSTQPGSLAWSPDGTRLAYVDKSPGQEEHDAVLLWDFKANKAMPPLTGAEGRLRVIAFAPDGSRLAAAGSDLNIHVWDMASGREPLSISTEGVHIESISALAWSPCATMIASSCNGGLSYQGIAIWNLEDGRKLGDLPQHLGGDRALVWLADPPNIIGTSGGRDGRTCYYDLTRGAVRQDTETGTSLLCRVGTTDKAILVQGNGDVRFCEPTGLGRSVAKLPQHPGAPTALAVAPDGQTIACGSRDGSIRFVDPATGESLRLDAEGPVQSLVFSPDTDPEESKLAVTTESWNESRRRMESATTVYHVKKRRQLWRFEDERIDDLAWSHDGTSIATVGDNLIIWDGRTGIEQSNLDREAESVAWVRGGTAIALGSQSAMELVDAKDGGDILSFAEPTDSRRLLAWSEVAGRLAVTTGPQGAAEIALVAADAGAAPSRISARGHEQPIVAMGWQADGKIVLTGSLSETCGWDMATGERTSKSAIGSHVFSADGSLAMLGGPSMIRLHQPQHRKLLRTILIFADHKYAVVSPDGHHDGSCQSEDIVYVVQTQEGQLTLDEKQFATRYGWKNDPGKLAAGQQ
jgi:serine/threonine protein kinase/WD40 repeat protein